jgi:CBS domain containing-hemolysin-like protein
MPCATIADAKAKGEGRIVADGLSSWDIISLCAIPALVVMNGLFVAAEFALVSVRKTRLEELSKQGITAARAAEAAMRDMSRSIAATQLGITLASIGLGFVGEPALARLLEPLFTWVTDEWRPVAAHSVATPVAFLLITFMHVVFGELVPKSMSLQKPDQAALWLARPLIGFAFVTRPVILLMNVTANSVLRAFGFQPAAGEEMVHSVDELSLLIEDTEEAGILEPDQADYVQNVFELTDKHVGDCMVPRDKMASLELQTPADKVLEAVRSGAHTRMPVYENDINNIVGIVNTKDLFHLLSLRGVVILQDAIYPALFLKPDENLDNALRLFRKAKRHMALVRDEQDRILGLITLEDVLEEIVGELEDEHDRPASQRRLRVRRAVANKLAARRPKKVDPPPANSARGGGTGPAR